MSNFDNIDIESGLSNNESSSGSGSEYSSSSYPENTIEINDLMVDMNGDMLQDDSSSNNSEGKLIKDPSVDKFIRLSLERDEHQEHIEDIRYSMKPKNIREYDEEVNGEITKFEKQRLIGFLIAMVLATPIIIYGMYNFSKDYSCSEDSTGIETTGSGEYVECPIANLWINIALMVIMFATVGLVAGTIAVKTNFNVGYTRKMLHFSSFFLPFAVDEIVEVPSHFSVTFLKFWLILAVYILATKPIRRKFYPAGLMFRAIDRPEDRPHTLFWLVTQFISSGLVFLPFISYWNDKQNDNPDEYSNEFAEELSLIVVLINGLGDGLAEPVGVKFGGYEPFGKSLKYKTRGYWLETEKVNNNLDSKCGPGSWFNFRIKLKHDYFTRSYPGSFMVWLVSFISILALNNPFTTDQLVIAAIFVPPLMTLTEAFSPRTWDSPFLFLVGSLLLTIIIELPV